MSKLTFRADDELVSRLEALDASKSQVIREALRRYLDEERGTAPGPSDGIDLNDVVDRAIEERVARAIDRDGGSSPVNVTLEVTKPQTGGNPPRPDPGTTPPRRTRCPACGEPREPDHAFCPHCGTGREEACDGCGHRLREEWAFCPGCGCRAPTHDVIDRS